MKKRIFIVSLVLMLLISIPAQAAVMRRVGNAPTLSFSGTTASCFVSVTGKNANDSISVVMRLWDGSECIRTWTGSGTMVVSLSKTATVTKGHTYTLTVDAYIGGVLQPRTSTSGTC